VLAQQAQGPKFKPPYYQERRKEGKKKGRKEGRKKGRKKGKVCHHLA
jgi:predicted transposase YdaD